MQTDTIVLPEIKQRDISLHLRREDLTHPMLSGNKFRKLKYNLQEAKKSNCTNLLTFGGAYSNHIPAAAYAASANGMSSRGIIRGEELADRWKNNPTLVSAAKMGMEFEFVSREEYRLRENKDYQADLLRRHKNPYLIPEGGTNALGVKGCEEILTTEDRFYDVICCSVGTGGTLAGLSNSACEHQKLLGFPALKGDFLKEDIGKYTTAKNWTLITTYHFGGYGRVTKELVAFINSFKEKTKIPLDPIYTAKMMFGIIDMVKQGKFKKGAKILAIHTGGLQGIEGMNGILRKKNLPLLSI
ncbi:1-aminocyclopropane-1-carboxylate deaminase/D-cysteine desulfhydrase [Muriicola soli]|uniref:1-aminocyclopropane-1-carboxylate deaminase/D-cysteine desulfhydrase n=1 Tax=Muriicola soli TaxID=2507538 RepID=A0A411EDE1_9FLAO|nr:1-aminocyclopropane-1-carboxylate deaminase/D-cysteine desulfhydrase [Muriicola soli]